MSSLYRQLRAWCLCLAVLLAPGFHIPVWAKETPPYERLAALSAQMLKDLENGDMELYREHLAQSESIVTGKDIPLNAEQLDALLSSLLAAKRSLASLSMENIGYNTLMFYLAVDAIGHRSNPQWKNYHVKIKTHLNDLLNKAADKDEPAVQQAWTRAKREYLLVRPAVLISEGSGEAERMDSLYRYTEGLLRQEEMPLSSITAAIAKMNEAWDRLYLGHDRGVWSGTLYNASPVKLAAAIGLMILLIFSYVLWKKFRSDRPITIPWR